MDKNKKNLLIALAVACKIFTPNTAQAISPLDTIFPDQITPKDPSVQSSKMEKVDGEFQELLALMVLDYAHTYKEENKYFTDNVYVFKTLGNRYDLSETAYKNSNIALDEAVVKNEHEVAFVLNGDTLIRIRNENGSLAGITDTQVYSLYNTLRAIQESQDAFDSEGPFRRIKETYRKHDLTRAKLFFDNNIQG